MNSVVRASRILGKNLIGIATIWIQDGDFHECVTRLLAKAGPQSRFLKEETFAVRERATFIGFPSKTGRVR
jgi:hypothetical protein